MARTLISMEGNETGWHENGRNETPCLRDGFAVVREEDLPLLHQACGCVSFDLEELPRAEFLEIADLRTEPTETFPVAINLVNVYTPSAPPPAPMPAELREAAYDSEAILPWPVGGEAHITITEAARLWTYYTSEGDTVTATALTERIAAAKGVIRGRYPDVSDLDTAEVRA